MDNSERRKLAREREAVAEARRNGSRVPAPRAPKPVVSDSAYRLQNLHKPKPPKLPGHGQPLPECARERALFLQLQFDAVEWRKRIMPEMENDPAKYFANDGSAPGLDE